MRSRDFHKEDDVNKGLEGQLSVGGKGSPFGTGTGRGREGGEGAAGEEGTRGPTRSQGWKSLGSFGRCVRYVWRVWYFLRKGSNGARSSGGPTRPYPFVPRSGCVRNRRSGDSHGPDFLRLWIEERMERAGIPEPPVPKPVFPLP